MDFVRPMFRAIVPRMPDRKLARIVTLEDGTTLRTIADAAAAIEKTYPPSLQWAPLQHAITLLKTAADTGKRADIAAATDQLARVLAISPDDKKPAARASRRRASHGRKQPS